MLRNIASWLQRHWSWLRWPIAVGILTLLFYRSREQFGQLAEREIAWGFLVLALALCGASITLTFLRWFLLVWALGFPFKVSDALRLGFVGFLFNYVAPGAAGGDLVKAMLMIREQKSRRTVAAATVLLDRLLGVLALFLVGAGAALFTPALLELRLVRLIAIGLVTGSLCGLAGLAVLLHPAATRLRLVRWAESLAYVGRPFTELVEALRLYQQRRGVIVATVAMSIVGHFGILSSFYFCARALDTQGGAPGFWAHLLLIPGAELFSVLIPLPGGVGALEGAVSAVYGLADQAAGGVLGQKAAKGLGLMTAIAYRVVTIVIAAVGAGYYLVSRREIDEVLDEVEHDEASAGSATKPPLSSAVSESDRG